MANQDMTTKNANANVNMPFNTFRNRYLKFEFRIGLDKDGKQQAFANGTTILQIENLRATVSIRYDSGTSLPECDCTIYNMNREFCDLLSTLGQYQKNPSTYGSYLVVYASVDNGSNNDQIVYSKVFEGGITVAYTDYGSVPEIIFHVSAMAFGGVNLTSAESLSFKAKAPVGQVVQKIVDAYNKKISTRYGQYTKVTFQNCGVDTVLPPSNFHGDMIDQIRTCADQANFRFNLQDGVLYIWPKDKSVNASQKITKPVHSQVQKIFATHHFSTETGMVGYPAYANNGITVRAIFTRTLNLGEEVEVKSEYKVASGVWKYMISLQHELSCFTPNGPWFTTIGLSKDFPKEDKKGKAS